MKCPQCGESSGVIDSRKQPDNSVYRRRICQACKYRFSTKEVYVPPEVVDPEIIRQAELRKLIEEQMRDARSEYGNRSPQLGSKKSVRARSLDQPNRYGKSMYEYEVEGD